MWYRDTRCSWVCLVWPSSILYRCIMCLKLTDALPETTCLFTQAIHVPCNMLRWRSAGQTPRVVRSLSQYEQQNIPLLCQVHVTIYLKTYLIYLVPKKWGHLTHLSTAQSYKPWTLQQYMDCGSIECHTSHTLLLIQLLDWHQALHAAIMLLHLHIKNPSKILY